MQVSILYCNSQDGPYRYGRAIVSYLWADPFDVITPDLKWTMDMFMCPCYNNLVYSSVFAT